MYTYAEGQQVHNASGLSKYICVMHAYAFSMEFENILRLPKRIFQVFKNQCLLTSYFLMIIFKIAIAHPCQNFPIFFF